MVQSKYMLDLKVKEMIYLEWLSDAHNGAHIVAIVSQYEVPRILGQFFLGKNHLEKSKPPI